LAVVADLAAELVAAPLDLDVLAELVAIALGAAVVAELATGVPSSTRLPGAGDAVIAERGGGGVGGAIAVGHEERGLVATCSVAATTRRPCSLAREWRTGGMSAAGRRSRRWRKSRRVAGWTSLVYNSHSFLYSFGGCAPRAVTSRARRGRCSGSAALEAAALVAGPRLAIGLDVAASPTRRRWRRQAVDHEELANGRGIDVERPTV
jgi:hypothetical protein